MSRRLQRFDEPTPPEVPEPYQVTEYDSPNAEVFPLTGRVLFSEWCESEAKRIGGWVQKEAAGPNARIAVFVTR